MQKYRKHYPWICVLMSQGEWSSENLSSTKNIIHISNCGLSFEIAVMCLWIYDMNPRIMFAPRTCVYLLYTVAPVWGIFRLHKFSGGLTLRDAYT